PPPPPPPPLLPYTTLFRSRSDVHHVRRHLVRRHDVGPLDLLQESLRHFRRAVPCSRDQPLEALDKGSVEHHRGIPRYDLQFGIRSEEHTSELQSRENLVCR